MRSRAVILLFVGIGLGAVGGFVAANAINRSEIESLRSELDEARSSSNPGAGASRDELSEDEIRSKIAEADSEPTNAAYQKNLGLALYKYGSIKSDASVITEAIRLLERAYGLDPSDQELVLGLGNAWFDLGSINKDNNALRNARKYYESLLKVNPQAVDIMTDLGITYFLEDPPNDSKAAERFKAALATERTNEKALEFLVQALARQGDRSGAARYLDRLRKSHPSNPSIAALTARIEATGSDTDK